MARIQVGALVCRTAARRRFQGRGRIGRNAHRLLRHLVERSRPDDRRLCRIRRHSRLLAGRRALSKAARGDQQVCRGPYRSAFRPRHRRPRRLPCRQACDGAERRHRHAALPGRAGREDVRLQAGACRQGLLRRARRRHQLPPAFLPGAQQRLFLGHPFRALLEPHLHLRMQRSGDLAEPAGCRDRGARPFRRPRARRDRRGLPDVHLVQVHQGGDAAAHRKLEPQRIHRDGGTGRRRQSSAPASRKSSTRCARPLWRCANPCSACSTTTPSTAPP